MSSKWSLCFVCAGLCWKTFRMCCLTFRDILKNIYCNGSAQPSKRAQASAERVTQVTYARYNLPQHRYFELKLVSFVCAAKICWFVLSKCTSVLLYLIRCQTLLQCARARLQACPRQHRTWRACYSSNPQCASFLTVCAATNFVCTYRHIKTLL